MKQFFNLNLEHMNLLRSLAVISSPNERKMPDALSPSQIHILFGNGEAEKKPVRTKLLHEEPSTSLNLTLFTRRKTVIN